MRISRIEVCVPDPKWHSTDELTGSCQIFLTQSSADWELAWRDLIATQVALGQTCQFADNAADTLS